MRLLCTILHHVSLMYRSMSTLESSSQIAFIRDEDQRTVCGKMSASRRTFSLLVTFDLIMTFILWGVYVKVRKCCLYLACTHIKVSRDDILLGCNCEWLKCYSTANTTLSH